jgi:hypothetical protein
MSSLRIAHGATEKKMLLLSYSGEILLPQIEKDLINP